MKTGILASSLVKGFVEKRRRRKIEEELTHCFGMIANAMKSGMSLPQALRFASKEAPAPLAGELESILGRVQLGHSLKEALLLTEASLKIPDFSMMVHSLILLNEVGGNIVFHLEKLEGILRERQKVSGKIALLTAQGMTQGLFLGFLPPALIAGLYLFSPEFVAPLFQGSLGFLSLFLIFLLDLGGYLWMKKLARVTV